MRCRCGPGVVWNLSPPAATPTAALLAGLIRDGEIGRFPETAAALAAEVEQRVLSRTVKVHVPEAEPEPKAVVSAVVSASAAVATTSNFILGSTTANVPDAPTAVTAKNVSLGGLNAKLLQLTNNSTGSSATALGLTTPGSRPPMIVSSGAKVANLNADKLDGIDSGGFLPKTGKAADADKLDGVDSNGFVRGPGRTYADAAAIARPDGNPRIYTASPAVLPGIANIEIECPAKTADFSGIARVWVRNLSGSTAHVFAQSSRFPDSTWYQSLSGTARVGFPADDKADIMNITFWGATETEQVLSTIADPAAGGDRIDELVTSTVTDPSSEGSGPARWRRTSRAPRPRPRPGCRA